MNENNSDINDRPVRELSSPHVALALVLDVSCSMQEEVIGKRKIDLLNKAINEMIEFAKKDERLFNIMDLGIFIFGDPNRNKVLQGFRAIRDCEEINLQANDGSTYVAEALNTAVDRLRERTMLYAAGGGGNAFVPWLVLITDGEFHDNQALEPIAERIKQREREKKLHFFGFGVPGYDRNQLEKFSETPSESVIDIDARNFTELFNRIGRSMAIISRATPGSDVELPTFKIGI